MAQIALSRRKSAVCAVLISTALAVLIPAAVALAAHPITSARYTGHGTQYFNNTPDGSYTNRYRTPAHISFHVSRNGRRVLDFSGQYAVYCGTGTTSVTDHWISVDRSGFFSVSGSYPSYDYNHKRDGTTYATIKGQFFDGGHRARIFYKVMTRFTGSKQPPCGTEVRGTVRTR